MGRPSDALTPFLIQLATPMDQYLTQIGTRHPKNERGKTCVGSITATDYARTRSDYIHFCLYILGRQIDTVAAVLDTVGHPNRPIFDTDWSKTPQK